MFQIEYSVYRSINCSFLQYRVLYNHDFYIIQIIVTAKSAAEPVA